MIKVGVIAEYNPFHNGHLYHLNETKKMFKDAYYILILIGNFTQRAEASIINKWDKTKIALDYGYDLVIELPYYCANQSANYYAKGAIEILNKLECDYLVFGSETNDIELFKKLANITKDNTKYEDLIKKYLDEGYNYPVSCSLALKEVSNIVIDKPNDVLALEYVRSIIYTNSKIEPISIKRTNDYHSTNIENEIVSATSIRKNINDLDLIKKTMPKDIIKYIKIINNNKYFELLKYEIISNDHLSDFIDVNEGIENKIKSVILEAKDINDLILKIKSKRFSYNRIQRMLLHILCNDRKDDNDLSINYIRVLGLNNNGKKILKEIKDKIDIPIITIFKKEYHDLFKRDLKANMIYSLITDYNYKEEFRSSIKKD